MLHCSNAPRGMPCHNLSVFDKRPTMESGISRLHGVPVCLCCSIPIRPLRKLVLFTSGLQDLLPIVRSEDEARAMLARKTAT